MLSEKLRRLRREKGLSQSELAEKLDVSRQAVSRWEAGDAAPGIDNLKSLRDLYGVSIDYLISDEDGETVPAPEPVPELAEAQCAPTPIRSRRTVTALLIAALAVAVVVIILLLLPKQAQENSDPFSGFDGSSPVYGEDGKPIGGESLDGLFDGGEFSREPLDSVSERN